MQRNEKSAAATRLRWTGPALLVLALGVAQAGCGSDGPSVATGDGAEREVLVEMAPVDVRDFDVTLDAVGTAYASGQVDIRPQVGGILVEAPFVEGSPAKEGDVLVRLDDSKARASLALAEAQLDSARAKLDVATERLNRYRHLAAEDLVSREEYSTLESEQKAAAAAVRENEAEVRLARRNLEDYTLRAPFSGRMGIRILDTGNFVEAGTVIATLVQADPLEVLFTVPSSAMEGIEVGLEAKIHSTDPERTLIGKGSIRVIDARIDTDTRMLSIKALVPNPEGRIQAGQFVGVSLVRERRRDAIVVPEDAVVPYSGKTWVYVVRDGRASRQEVTLGTRLPEVVEITSGLSPGDVIVTRGQHRLGEGAKVKAQNAGADPEAAAAASAG